MSESKIFDRIEEEDKLYLKGTMDVWVVNEVTDASIQLTNTQQDQVRRYKIDAFKKDFYFKLNNKGNDV